MTKSFTSLYFMIVYFESHLKVNKWLVNITQDQILETLWKLCKVHFKNFCKLLVWKFKKYFNLQLIFTKKILMNQYFND